MIVVTADGGNGSHEMQINNNKNPPLVPIICKSYANYLFFEIFKALGKFCLLHSHTILV